MIVSGRPSWLHRRAVGPAIAARAVLLVSAMILASVVLPALPTSAAPAGATTIIDIQGRSVVVNTPVQRVILVEGRQTYIVASLDTDNPFKRVVGWGDDLRTADYDSYLKYQQQFPHMTEIPVFGSPQSGTFSADITRYATVWEIRLPMALMAVMVGASLAIAGAEMQTILNNPLASPFTLGISAAASFGAAVALVLGVGIFPYFDGMFFVAANAFVFAMLASLIIFAFSMMRGVTAETMVLLGIALVFLFQAFLALLQYIASEQALQQVIFWSLGSLAKSSWPKLGLTALVVALTTPSFLRSSWQLTALRLGDERARSLGVDVQRLRLVVLVGVSVLAATAVAFVGTIGFVGLVGPHVARMVVGEEQRYFLPASALAGAILLATTSLVSKSIIPGVIVPVGIITALIGVPFFLALIFSRRRQLWS